MDPTDPTDRCPELDPHLWDAHRDLDDQAMAAQRFTQPLQRRCLRALADAWANLNYQFLGSALRPPSIRLHDDERRWGSWDPSRRLITISRRQVLCYRWDSVLETLKHELAHQVVSELLHADHEPPHGPAFQDACRRLAADPAPRGTGGHPLHRPGDSHTDASPHDATLAKIHKLLNLASHNPNEHEAKAAFAHASKLMLDYNLRADRQAHSLNYTHRLLGASSGRVPHHHYAIAGILQEFFFVQCLWIDSYVVHTGVRGHTLEILGQPHNVDMADYIHDCLHRQTNTLWRSYKRAHAITDRRAKRQYLDGLLAGFRRQLRSSQRQQAQHGLVWLGDPALERYYHTRHPKVARAHLSSVHRSTAHQHGLQHGAQLRLHKPLTSSLDSSHEVRLICGGTGAGTGSGSKSGT